MVHTLVFLQTVPYPTGYFICDICHEKGSGPVLHCSACLFDLHPTCIATGQQISHFSHFSHPLIAETLDSHRTHTCDVCGDPAFPTVYHCSECDFDSHPHCARSPRFIQHPHHKHLLQLIPKQEAYVSGSCWCDACGKEATNFVYHCSVCKFDLHISCAMLPRNPLHHKHPEHRLKLFIKAEKIRRGMPCRECRKDSSNWMYGCEECGFYMHVGCADIPRHEITSVCSGHSHSSSVSSSDIETVVKVMDKLLVSSSSSSSSSSLNNSSVSSCEGRAMRKVMKMLEQQQQGAPISIISASLREGSDRNTCLACLDDYGLEGQRRNLRCGHHFHTGCILRWLDSSNRCPVCRQQILLLDGT